MVNLKPPATEVVVLLAGHGAWLHGPAPESVWQAHSHPARLPWTVYVNVTALKYYRWRP